MQQETPTFTKYILSRINKNKDFRGLFVGQTGSGKSYSCLSLAKQLDPTFGIDRVCFSPKEFISLINSGALSKGSVIIFEEVGVNFASRQWQSPVNKMLSYYMQTSRALNYILFLNTPDSSFLDLQARKTIHCFFEMVRIDWKKNETICKPLLIQVNSRSGKIYMKYLRISTSEGVMPFTRLRIPKPERDLVEMYEVKKKKFLTELNLEIEKEINYIEDSKSPELTPLQETVVTHLQNRKNYHEVGIEMGLTYRAITSHIRAIKKKGFKIIPVKEKGKPHILYYNVVEG